jgi:hypothetical protein
MREKNGRKIRLYHLSAQREVVPAQLLIEGQNLSAAIERVALAGCERGSADPLARHLGAHWSSV